MNEVKIIGITDDKFSVTLSCDIDAGKAEEFYNAVIQGYEETPADILFQCDGLEFIDSTTLGTFVKILKKAKANGHKMTLVGLQAKVKKLFLICSLDKIMEIA